MLKWNSALYPYSESSFTQITNSLVSSFEVTPVMAASLKQQSHVKITFQHSITHKHFFSTWLPFLHCPSHHWTIGRKIHTIKANFIVKTVAIQSDEKISETYCYQPKKRRYSTQTNCHVVSFIFRISCYVF